MSGNTWSIENNFINDSWIHKHIFQPKNPTHRDAIKKSNTTGLAIHGEQRTQTFPNDVIEEAIIISDLFDLNEFASLELLLAGKFITCK